MPDATIAARTARVRSWRRDTRLKRLGFPSYEAYINSSTWATTRHRYRKSNRPQDCALCDSAGTIVLHHVTYERVGDEALDDLVPLCKTCHGYVHDLERSGYIESLDPKAVEELRNNRRAWQNQTKAAKEQGERAPQYELILSRESQASAQTCVNRLKEALRRAEKEAVVVEELIGEINELSKAMHAKISETIQERGG